jgi:hypothetical protein
VPSASQLLKEEVDPSEGSTQDSSLEVTIHLTFPKDNFAMHYEMLCQGGSKARPRVPSQPDDQTYQPNKSTERQSTQKRKTSIPSLVGQVLNFQ